MRRIGALIGWFTLAGLGTAQAQADQDLDPVGTYEWQVSLEGGEVMSGSFAIECPEDECTGYSYSDIGTSPILEVTVEGQRLVLQIDGGEMGPITVELTMDGKEFTGFGLAGGQEYPLSGIKVES